MFGTSDSQVEEGAIAEAATAAPRKALVVEDDYSVLQLMRLLLEDAGYDVLLARGASDALTIVKATTESIGLAIIDLNLPGFDGRQLALQLSPYAPALRVLYASGAPASDVPGLPLVSDASFIQKPFSHAEFRAKIADAQPGWPDAGGTPGASLTLANA